MGRPPCCDKIGVKKGPWTPEEDIILVSYIQEHGPGNWRAVPTNTGLLRCSKSCRLRWTNYLRPGIKRGNFTEHEEKMIIHLQALLGNRWAAIASYLPQRTDNDIKNFWNTHLKKKLGISGHDHGHEAAGDPGNSSDSSKGQWERRLQTDIHTAKQALCDALSLNTSNQTPSPSTAPAKLPAIESRLLLKSPPPIQTAAVAGVAFSGASAGAYVSSAENIARLLENWGKKSPNLSPSTGSSESNQSLISFNNNPSIGQSSSSRSEGTISTTFNDSGKPSSSSPNNLTLLEKWLLDEMSGQGQGQEQDHDFMEITADLF